MEKLEIVKATNKDCKIILECLRGLATYAGQLDELTATEDMLKKSLFGENSTAEVRFGYLKGKLVGFILFFDTYSTFRAKKGIFIEDFFIFQEYRSKGFGRELFESVINHAKQHDYNKVEWHVVNTNIEAVYFYEKMKAKKLDYKSTYYITI